MSSGVVVRAAASVILAIVTAACGRTDAAVQRDIQSRLIVDDATIALKLNITADRGTVRLSGAARTRQQYRRAIEIAREVVGAGRVVDEIRLNEPPLAAAVYTAIEHDPLVARVPLEVDALDRGVVVLRSTRTNEAQRSRILQIATQVPGVSRVDDYMK